MPPSAFSKRLFLANSRVRAAFGDSNALLQLAHWYWIGTGVPRDAKRAVFFAARASSKGRPEADVLLAAIFLSDFPPEQGHRLAFEAYGRAAGRDFADGQHGLGWCYEQGVGVARDLSAAFDWYRAAADNGRIENCLEVSRMLVAGTHVPRDLAMAAWYLDLARKSGESMEIARIAADIARLNAQVSELK